MATCAATSAWGALAIDEHLARQRGARAMRDARDARSKLADGSEYTGRPTEPETETETESEPKPDPEPEPEP